MAVEQLVSPHLDFQFLGEAAPIPRIEIDRNSIGPVLARSVDFVALEEANRSLGLAGEQLVLPNEAG